MNNHKPSQLQLLLWLNIGKWQICFPHISRLANQFWIISLNDFAHDLNFYDYLNNNKLKIVLDE